MRLSEFEKYRTGNIIETKLKVDAPSNSISSINTIQAITINLLAHECNMSMYDLLKEYRSHQLVKPRKPLIFGKTLYRLQQREWELVEKKFKQILSGINISFLDEVV